MGTVIHRSVVVSADLNIAGQLMDIAEGLGLSFSDLSAPKTNGYRYFFIHPCGSKEGWDEQERHSASLSEFIDRLKTAEVEYAAVAFGRDLGGGINVVKILP